MKIGFVSDTHGSKYFWDMAEKYLDDCEEIIHCGDVLYHGPRNDIPGGYDPKNLAAHLSQEEKMNYVQGNCDSSVDIMVLGLDDMETYEIFDFDGLKILAHHGDRISPNEALEKARQKNVKIIVSGHTHIKKLEKTEDGIIILNPGSTAIPKDGIRSIAIYEDNQIYHISIEDGEILNKIEI